MPDNICLEEEDVFQWNDKRGGAAWACDASLLRNRENRWMQKVEKHPSCWQIWTEEISQIKGGRGGDGREPEQEGVSV